MKLWSFALAAALLCHPALAAPPAGNARPVRPKCEYLANPLGVDVRAPRFSWEIASSRRGERQTAYQVLVASTPERLAAGEADKWDSGRVESPRSVNVPYAGDALSSHQRCWWRVRAWDRDGVAAESEPAWFEMAKLSPDDWRANWIATEAGSLFRKRFTLRGPVSRARASISGLGWFELYINGRRVGDHVLDPAMTNYHQRVLYVTHDITGQLQAGENAVGVMLGNGWFSEPGRNRYGSAPMMIAEIDVEYADGARESIVTDASWRAADGPIVENSIPNGEVYDARREREGWATSSYDDANWQAVQLVDGPGGKLVSQLVEPIRVVADLPALSRSEPAPGACVYDFGQVFGGWARVKLRGPAGSRVTIQYSERLDDAGLVLKRNHPTPQETDVYILRGDPQGETYEPRFTFHPCRYVQIESGDAPPPQARDVVGRVVHSDVDLSTTFHCSNELLNQIARATDWTVKNCWYGMPLDCLHREPFPYLEPAETPANLYNRQFMPRFWTKWLDDIRDEQRTDGAIPVVVPNYARHTSTDPAWSGNYPLAVWYLYQYYEDERLLADHYDSMRAWVDYLTSQADDRLILEGTWGDHMAPGPSPGEEEYVSPLSPPPLLWTGTYFRDAAIVAEAAAALGKMDDAERYARLAAEIKDALNAKWFDAESGDYAGGAQTSNAFALAIGVAPRDQRDRVVDNLIRDIAETNHNRLTTGIIGVTSLVEAFDEPRGAEALYRVVNRREYPGWGYMVDQGATTLWESWGRDMRRARGREESMAMFATISEFLYTAVAGIAGPDYYGPGAMPHGFGAIRIRPLALGDLAHAEASVRTIRGVVASSWRREGDDFHLDATIPGNCTAQVSIPAVGRSDATIREGDKIVWQSGKFIPAAEGIAAAAADADFITFEVGSGEYRFQRSAPSPSE